MIGAIMQPFNAGNETLASDKAILIAVKKRKGIVNHELAPVKPSLEYLKNSKPKKPYSVHVIPRKLTPDSANQGVSAVRFDGVLLNIEYLRLMRRHLKSINIYICERNKKDVCEPVYFTFTGGRGLLMQVRG